MIRREQESLYRMAFLYTRNEEDALDALQEGILKAYTHRKTLRKPEHFKTWLMRIVINSAQDLMKKRRPAAEWDELEELSAPEGCRRRSAWICTMPWAIFRSLCSSF